MTCFLLFVKQKSEKSTLATLAKSIPPSIDLCRSRHISVYEFVYHFTCARPLLYQVWRHSLCDELESCLFLLLHTIPASLLILCISLSRDRSSGNWCPLSDPSARQSNSQYPVATNTLSSRPSSHAFNKRAVPPNNGHGE